MDRLMQFMTALSVVLILLVLGSLRRAHIRVEYSVSWLLAAVALLLLSRIPAALNAAAEYLGISYPPLALVLITGCVFLITFFRHSVIISKLRDDNIALAQRLAILEYHLQNFKNSVTK